MGFGGYRAAILLPASLVLVLALTLVLAVSPGHSSASVARTASPSEPVTVTYAGFYTETLEDLYLTGDKQGRPQHTITQTVNWKFVWSGQLSTLESSAVSLRWNGETLSGSISNTWDADPAQNCIDGSLSAIAGQTFSANQTDPGGPIGFSIFSPQYHSKCDGAGCPAPAVTFGPTYCDPAPSWKPDVGGMTFPENGKQSLNSSGRDFSGSVQSTVTISGRSCQVGGASDSPMATVASRKLIVKAGPGGTNHYVTGLKYKFNADAACSRPPDKFVWKRLPSKKNSPYLRVAPNSKKQTVNGTSSQLPITMKCVLPPKVKRNSPESWRQCQSIVIFEVTVTDSKGNTGKDLAGFIADPQCSSRARKQVARRTIARAAEEIWGEIPRHIADEIGVKGIEHALEAGELGPALALLGVANLGVDILSHVRDANDARADLAEPNC